MPMIFPDFQSLKNAAEVHHFRQPKENETEDIYREKLADYVADRDLVESYEIRYKSWPKKYVEKKVSVE